MARKHTRKFKNFADNIKAKELSFTDNYFNLVGSYINTDYGFNYIAYDALKDVNDVKSNNYSNIILTKKQNTSNIVEINTIKEKSTKDFISPLSFFAADNSNQYNPPVLLSFAKTYDDYDIAMETSPIQLVVSGKISDSVLFRITCLDEQYCTISHNFAGTIFYLSYDGSFKYTTNYVEDYCKFTYHMFDKKMNLYMLYKGMLFIVACENVNNAYYLVMKSDITPDKSSDIFISPEEEYTDKFLDSSWIRYAKDGGAIDLVKAEGSSFHNESQFIIHNEYADDNVNLIPLKNTLTYQGTNTNGQSLRISSNGKFINDPMVDFRNYTSLHTGYNQERGTENITVSFIFTDQVIRLNEGDNCIITIPKTTESGLSPLYPYEALNVNDAPFIRNGAFGSDVPFFADKFRKLQNESTYSMANNYTYLCTWLYQPDEKTVPVWLDRYYYPDMISRVEALGKPADKNIFSLSFENILDKYYLKDSYTDAEKIEYSITPEVEERLNEFKTKLKNETFVDKKSDLIFSPGTNYQYSRISKETVDELYNKLSSNRIDYVKDKYSNEIPLDDLISLNGENWCKIPADFFQNSQQLSFNTNIFINPRKKMGIQLFGMDYKKGFNIQNRKDLIPFTYYATPEAIYMMNNSFQICNEFNMKDSYGEEIIYLVISAPFDDIYVITKNYVFTFDYDLQLKNQVLYSKFTYSPADGDSLGLGADKRNEETGKTILEILAETYIVQQNNILYAVYNEPKGTDYYPRVAKINLATNNIQFLKDNQFFNNFTVSKDNSLDQTTAFIKSLYIDKMGQLYAFNYDILKVAHDNETIYGIITEKNYKTDDNWYYIFNQSLSTLNTSIAASKYAEFVSDVSIDNLAFGPDGYFALARGFADSVNEKDKNLEIYDKSKTKIYNYPLKEYTEILSLDYCRYIDNAGNEHDSFIALLTYYGSLSIIEYQIDNERILVYNSSLSGNCISTFKNITDSNTILPYLTDNSIYFNLYLPDNKGCITKKWDLSEVQEGWYNINIEANLDDGIFKIKINGDEHDMNFKNIDIIDDDKHAYTNVSALDGIYYFGILGKQYGASLNEILGGTPYNDPYAWKNSKIEYTTLYNKSLKYHEYQANNLHYSDINPLVLTIPCGVRNGIEEIVRYFKFNKPASYTNKIKINISGLTEDITMESEIASLKEDIINALEESDCLTEIKEIEFI